MSFEHSVLVIRKSKEDTKKRGDRSSHIPSVPLGVMELLLMCELSRLGPLGDSLLPLTRLWGLARSCISIDLTRHKHTRTRQKSNYTIHSDFRTGAQLWYTTHCTQNPQVSSLCFKQNSTVMKITCNLNLNLSKYLSSNLIKICFENTLEFRKAVHENQNYTTHAPHAHIYAPTHWHMHIEKGTTSFQINDKHCDISDVFMAGPLQVAPLNNVFTVNLISCILNLKKKGLKCIYIVLCGMEDC